MSCRCCSGTGCGCSRPRATCRAWSCWSRSTPPRCRTCATASRTERLNESAALELLAEPAGGLGPFALGAAVELDEVEEQVGIVDPGHHAVEARLVEAAVALHLAPQRVGAVVQLDHGERWLVVGEALCERPRPGGVMVRAGLGEPLVDAVLESVVHQGDEAQDAAALAVLAALVDRAQQVGHVDADGTLRMPGARLAPGEPLTQFRSFGYGPLELVLGLEPRDQLGRGGGR